MNIGAGLVENWTAGNALVLSLKTGLEQSASGASVVESRGPVLEQSASASGWLRSAALFCLRAEEPGRETEPEQSARMRGDDLKQGHTLRTRGMIA